jgi:hypothetical protein
MEMRTNRDLYRFVSVLVTEFADTRRTLEEYLRALHALGARHAAATTVTLDDFALMLRDAFSAEPSSVDPAWDKADLRFDDDSPGYAGWERTLASQILDLRLMAHDGTLEKDLRYFGTTAKRPRRAKRPTSSYWFNFDPLTYIECGTVGAFGGWEPGDDAGRELVPGLVAVLDESGAVREMEAEDIKRPIVELSSLGWATLVDFLTCGQLYE